MFRYVLIKQQLHSVDLGNYESFGIQVIKETGNQQISCGVLSDISLNRSDVEDLVHRCNALDLHPIHLRDVVDNYLNS